MITAQAQSEPVRHERRPQANPRRQLARYLMQNAIRPTRLPAQDRLRSGLPDRVGDASLTRGDQDYTRALAVMRQAWTGARGYFPGHAMPVPRFGGKDAAGAVGWARTPEGDPLPVGIRLNRGMAQMLASRDSGERDSGLLTLLHEWAHNFQRPELYGRRERGSKVADRRVEGGAEAFSVAAAPIVARLAGLPYRAGRATLAQSEYRPQALSVTLKRGMPWIMRGQFREAR